MAGLIKRGNIYHALYYVGKKQKRVSLETSNLQLAKEKLRQIESSLYRGGDSPLPTKTPIATVVANYIEHMWSRKTARSVERDIYYLRETFGPICPDLTLKNPKISAKGKKCPSRHADVRADSGAVAGTGRCCRVAGHGGHVHLCRVAAGGAVLAYRRRYRFFGRR